MIELKLLMRTVSFNVAEVDLVHTTLDCVAVYIGSSHDFSITQLEADITVRKHFRKGHYKRWGLSR